MRKDLFSFAKGKYDEKLDKELDKLDEEIKALQIEMSDEPDRKITKKYGLHLNKRMRFADSIKVAIAFFVLVYVSATYITLNPKVVTGIKNLYREMQVKKTEQTVELGVTESDFWLELPEEYHLAETKESKLVIKKRYEDNLLNYIEVSLFTKEYEITIDKEQSDYFKETEIGGNEAIIISKKGITTIFLLKEKILYEIESNIPLKDALETAKELQVKN